MEQLHGQGLGCQTCIHEQRMPAATQNRCRRAPSQQGGTTFILSTYCLGMYALCSVHRPVSSPPFLLAQRGSSNPHASNGLTRVFLCPVFNISGEMIQLAQDRLCTGCVPLCAISCGQRREGRKGCTGCSWSCGNSFQRKDFQIGKHMQNVSITLYLITMASQKEDNFFPHFTERLVEDQGITMPKITCLEDVSPALHDSKPHGLAKPQST